MFAVSCASAGWCQDATLSGRLEDPSGSIVPNAIISVRHEQTGGRRATRSNQSGVYSVPSLRPGVYRVLVQAGGFETLLREGLVLEAATNARLDLTMRIGDTRTVVTVTAESAPVNAEDASVGTLIDRNFIERMPLNGRGLQSLIRLAPGVVTVPSSVWSPGQFAVNGQRTNANYFTVDGVSANFAAGVLTNTGGGLGNFSGIFGGGDLPALGQLGTFSNLVGSEALQEFRIQTSTYAPEFGRLPGGQVQLITASGTNRYSGSVFEYLRNSATDANDWFSNLRGLPKPARSFHDFGAVFGGPVQIPGMYRGRDRTVFLVSTEHILLRQPRQGIQALLVPTEETRRNASEAIGPLFRTLPLPNRTAPEGSGAPPGWAMFAGSRGQRTNQRSYAARVDHHLVNLIAFARVHYSDSRARDRSAINPASIADYTVGTRTFTAGLTHGMRPEVVNEFRVNASQQDTAVSHDLDDFGGAQRPSDSLYFPPGFSPEDSSVSIRAGFRTPNVILFLGSEPRSAVRQFQIVDNLSYMVGAHRFKVGVDLRTLSPTQRPPKLRLSRLLGGFLATPEEAFSATRGHLGVQRGEPIEYMTPTFAAYAQDTWRLGRDFVLTYGFRWDVDPAPRVTKGVARWYRQLTSVRDVSTIHRLPAGQPLYTTEYFKVAPRVGFAWQVMGLRDTVVRAGAGVFYESVQRGFEQHAFEASSATEYSEVPIHEFPTQGGAVQSPLFTTGVATIAGYSTPRTLQWNFTLEQAFGAQTLSAGYIGAAGRKLIARTRTFVSPEKLNLRLFGSPFSSDYHSLQLQYNRRLAGKVQSVVSYTWAHAIDNQSDELIDPGLAAFVEPDINRGSSNFDIRHSLTGAVLVTLPAPLPRSGFAALLRNWKADTMFFVRSAPPVDISSPGTFTGPAVRPDLVTGEPLYLYGSGYPGGRRINPGAFVAPPPGVEHGSLGRNVVSTFGAWQADVALHRTFALSEHLRVQLRVEAFNVSNHPNFATPTLRPDAPHRDDLGAVSFGQSRRVLGDVLSDSQEVLGQLNPAFQTGQPRSFQFAFRFSF
jgi:hypothetical protein